jgi:hypothetical protein
VNLRPIFTVAFGLALAAPGCASSAGCPVLDCESGVGVIVDALIPKVSSSLPVTLEVCLDTTCSAFQLTATGGAAPPECTDPPGSNALCSIDGEGTLILTTLPLPDGTAAGAVISVHATVTNKDGDSLFDGTTPVTVTASHPAGPSCPSCEGGQAVFTP